MNDENKHRIDRSKLTEEQRQRLDAYNQATAQIKSLKDIADMTEGIISLLDEQKDAGGKTSKEIGSLLMDMRDSLSALKEKKMPEMPDHAKPVVEAVGKLEKAIASAIKSIDVKPNVTVDAPQVHVAATDVDLKGIEKILKTDLPKAFDKAIKSIPKPEKEDNSDLLKAWEGISEQLTSLETATRMKPIPGSMAINNTSSNPVPITGNITTTVDTTALETVLADGTQKSQLVDAGGEAATVTGGKLDVNASVDTTGLALDATLTGGTQKSQLVDALGEAATVTGGKLDVNASVDTTGLATSAKQDTLLTELQSKADLTETQPVSLASVPSHAVTNAGTFAVQNTAATPAGTNNIGDVDVASLPVAFNTGTRSATTQRVTIATDDSVPVTGTFYQATQPVSGTVTANTGLTQPLTDTQLRATAVPVSGTVTANLSATDNAVLDDIALDTEAIKTSLAGTLTVTGGGGGIEYTEGDTDATIVGSAIMVEDAANTLQPLQGDKTNGLDVDVTRSALPTGAATSAKQLADNHNVVVTSAPTTPVTGTFYQATQPVSAATLPLPTGAATSAKQDTGNTSVASIDTKTPALGQALAAASVPVILPSATVTTLTPPAAITGFATESTLSTLNGKVTAVNTGAVVVSSSALPTGASTAAKQPALGTAGTASADVITVQGKALMTPLLTDGSATTQPVSGTFWQATQPVSGTVTANAGTNLNTSALATEAGNLASIKAKTDNIPALGQALAAASVPVILPSATVTTLTPPAAISGFATAANQLPDGHNVTVDNASLAVTGTFFQATQPVSLATAPTTPVTGTFWQATQPVSGTVTSNLSATDNAVLDSIDTSTASKYITGIGHGVKTVTTAGTDLALATSTACKKVTIQAQTDNTGVIAVGGSGVDATVATGTGILLFPGDAYELDIDNLADVFIDSSVNGEGVRFSYFT